MFYAGANVDPARDVMLSEGPTRPPRPRVRASVRRRQARHRRHREASGGGRAALAGGDRDDAGDQRSGRRAVVRVRVRRAQPRTIRLNHGRMHEEHGPAPTLWPLGFAVGIAVALVGLIVNPEWIASIGGGIAIVFGFLWARDATSEMRSHVPVVKAEVREATPAEVAAAPAAPEPTERFARSRFLEGATLGIGGIIGGIVTIPVARLRDPPVVPRAEAVRGRHRAARGVPRPASGSSPPSRPIRRRARSRAARLSSATTERSATTSRASRSSPTAAPISAARRRRTAPRARSSARRTSSSTRRTARSSCGPSCPPASAAPVTAASSTRRATGLPARPVRALDRYSFDIKSGHLVLLSTYSVSARRRHRRPGEDLQVQGSRSRAARRRPRAVVLPPPAASPLMATRRAPSKAQVRREQMIAAINYPLDWLEERSGLVGGVRYFLFRKVPSRHELDADARRRRRSPRSSSRRSRA